jgi:hypothetical protein
MFAENRVSFGLGKRRHFQVGNVDVLLFQGHMTMQKQTRENTTPKYHCICAETARGQQHIPVNLLCYFASQKMKMFCATPLCTPMSPILHASSVYACQWLLMGGSGVIAIATGRELTVNAGDN